MVWNNIYIYILISLISIILPPICFEIMVCTLKYEHKFLKKIPNPILRVILMILQIHPIYSFCKYPDDTSFIDRIKGAETVFEGIIQTCLSTFVLMNWALSLFFSQPVSSNS